MPFATTEGKESVVIVARTIKPAVSTGYMWEYQAESVAT